MASKMKKPPPPPQQQQKEDNEEGVEDSGEAIPEANAPADEVAASIRPKKSKLSGEVALPPKPKKTRDAPSPAPKRAKKAAPSQEEDGSEERPREESGEASAETDPPAVETTAASSPRKPSGEIVAGPQHNKKRAAASSVSKRAKKPSPPLEDEQRSDEEEVEVEAEAGVEEESGDARPVTNARADKTATQRKRSKPSGANAASPERKKRGKPSAKSTPRSKRDKAASNYEEVEQEKEQAEEDGVDNSGEALLERNASSAKLPGSKREKKPAVERSWSMDDELRILTTLAEHAQTHAGALLEASDLFAALAASFDRRDADTAKLANKVRKLRGRHERVRSQGCPADDHGRQLFELCEIVWGSGTLQNSIQGASMAPRRSLRNTSSSGHVVPEEAHQGGGGGEHTDAPTGALVVDVGACKDNSVPFVKDGDVNSGKFEDNGGQVDEDEQVKVTFVRREFSELSRLYPDLAKEVKGYAASHNSGELIMAAFETIGDDQARDLDARCKKQRIDMFNLEMSQAELTKALLCTLAGRIN